MPETTPGGIYLPLRTTQLPQLGHIIAIGKSNPDQLQIGDMVLVKKYEGQRLWIDDEEFYMFYVDDLLAKVVI